MLLMIIRFLGTCARGTRHAVIQHTRLVLLLTPWLLTPAESSGLLLDSPLGTLRHSAARAWLLGDVAPAAAAWPLPREDWQSLPVTPRLEYSGRQANADTTALLRWSEGDLRIGLTPRAEVARYLGPDGLGTNEAANGIDFEAEWAHRFAFWLHFRDAGHDGDLDLLEEPVFQADRNWLWTEINDGTLTHDEQRAGATLKLALTASSTVRFSLLRDHLRWGPGLLRTTGIQGDEAPGWPMFLLELEHGALSFLQTVGELHSMEWLDDSYPVEAGGRIRRELRQKWLIAHRLEWRARWGSLAAGESVILGDRRPGPGYLIPAALIWSEQHASGDRDNTMLFLDGRLRLPRALPGSWMAYAELNVDDYSLGDLGEELEGQRLSSLIGISGCPLPMVEGRAMQLASLEIPGISWLTLEHARQRPYAGGHFHAVNRFDHGGQSLAAFEHPNSRSLEWEWRHEMLLPTLRLGILSLEPLLEWSLFGSHLVHGANPDDENAGGDRYLPHRPEDGQAAPFLGGVLELQDQREVQAALSSRLGWRQRALGQLELGVGWTRLNRQNMRSVSLAWKMPF